MVNLVNSLENLLSIILLATEYIFHKNHTDLLPINHSHSLCMIARMYVLHSFVTLQAYSLMLRMPC